ncbi:MAG: hypothetical protein ACK55Z_10530, partial [bacterium]
PAADHLDGVAEPVDQVVQDGFLRVHVGGDLLVGLPHRRLQLLQRLVHRAVAVVFVATPLLDELIDRLGLRFSCEGRRFHSRPVAASNFLRKDAGLPPPAHQNFLRGNL